MMIDISPFKGFLSSLARISQIDYQIWDAKGENRFSTGNGSLKELPVTKLQTLCEGIVDRKDFHYISYDGYDYLCGIPIKNGQGIVGALVAIGSGTGEASKNDGVQEEMKDFLVYLAGLIEESFVAQEEIEEMAEELDQNFEDLSLYSRIASQTTALKFSRPMLKNLTEKLLENMRAEMAFAMFPTRPQYDIQIIETEVSDKFPEQRRFVESLITSIPADALSLKEGYFIINDSRKNQQYSHLAAQPYRFLTVRLQHHEVFYGWLGLVSFNLEEIFRQGELRLLTSIAEQLAVVIANTDLYEDLEHFIINMVKSLVFAIEAKDTYTRGHSERVSYYSLLIGKRLNLDEKEYNDLKWASILHDIGKIGIPESILNKPGPLTEDEFKIIKDHPVKGGNILKPVTQLVGSLAGIVHHHERYDGRGYPRGLKGKEIPMAARIIAVADTFDAFNSDRAYRAAVSPEKALAIVQELAGSQLDAGIVEVFKEIYEENPSIVEGNKHAK
jgi:HD-GYP domain-containing protein (c-di-GMP phosphodiesterase class II)